jgi:acyl-CoA dehydrogenase
MSDFEIPEEYRMLQETVRRFRLRHLQPLEQMVEEQDDLAPEIARSLRTAAIEAGLYGYNLPATFGGGGLPMQAQVIITEELGHTLAIFHQMFRISPTVRAASPEQRSWFVDPVVSGNKQVCMALTEPDAGSDLGRVRTNARRGPNGWILNGSKQFVSHADSADFIVVLAVTDASADLKDRFTTFIVQKDNPGLHISRRFRKMGWRGYHLAAFSLDQCEVPEDAVLGKVGGGFATVIRSVNETRISVGGRCVGMAVDLLERARDWSLDRTTFGTKLANHQAIQFKLADIDVELDAARLLTAKAAILYDRGDPEVRIMAARAKLYATEMLGRAADNAVQIFGGAGYMCDLPIERIYRDARAYRIGEGTSEMLRIQIARHVLSSGR